MDALSSIARDWFDSLTVGAYLERALYDFLVHVRPRVGREQMKVVLERFRADWARL